MGLIPVFCCQPKRAGACRLTGDAVNVQDFPGEADGRLTIG
jgi:hypothetical protein